MLQLDCLLQSANCTYWSLSSFFVHVLTMVTSSPARNTKSGKAESYVCDVCGAKFTRPDHLERHYRAHTKQRPFICPLCLKGFARRDLMTRHKANHNVRRGSANASSVNGFKYRVAQACRRCAVSKLKCTDEKPCPRCVKRNVPCETVENTPLRGPGAPGDKQQESRQDSEHHGDDASENGMDTFSDGSFTGNEIPTPGLDSGGQIALSEPILFSVPEPDSLWTMANFFDTGDQIADPMSTSDLMDLQHTDFSFLDQMHAVDGTDMVAPEIPNDTHASVIPVRPHTYSASSVARTWVPVSSEYEHMERANLALGGDIHDLAAKGQVDPGSQHLISVAARDRILNMVFVACPEKTSQIVEGFPSADILSKLVYRYISQHKTRRIDDFIHCPTFDWKSRRPELLAAMIALGSVGGPSSAVRKFGYALQSTVRRATIQRVHLCEKFW